MENLVYAHLANDANLLGLVGSNIYPTEPDANTQLPFIYYYFVGSTPTINLSGAISLSEYQLSVEIVALDFSTARAISDATVSLLHGWRNFPQVQGCFLRQRQTEQGQDDNGQTFHIITLNLSIFG